MLTKNGFCQKSEETKMLKKNGFLLAFCKNGKWHPWNPSAQLWTDSIAIETVGWWSTGGSKRWRQKGSIVTVSGNHREEARFSNQRLCGQVACQQQPEAKEFERIA